MPSMLPSVQIQHFAEEDGIVRGGLVEAGICEAVDEAESDCDSEDDPFGNIDEQ